MNETESTEKYQLREYLLGMITDEDTLRDIEERLVMDDEFGRTVETAECALIDEYLEGALTSEEKKHFELYFMASSERSAEVRLTNNLRLVAKRNEGLANADEIERSGGQYGFGWMRLAFAAGLLAIVAMGIWRFAIYKSDAEQGIAYLQKAIGGSRLIEPRVTILPDYAPFLVTRGHEADFPVFVDMRSRDRAERYLLDAAATEKNAASHQALAFLNLAERRYDRAIEEMNFALAAEPENAKILSDVGAIYLELAKRTDAEKHPTTKLEYLDNSLKYLDKAIALDAKLTEPRFNRALCLMELSIPERAREAWQEYLSVDPDSQWADEARKYLEALDKKQPKELSAAELETQFIAAVNANDERRAAELIGTNRELIRDKYLPQRLAASYVNSPDDRRDELLRALQYAGEIELKQTGDSFAKDIALFHAPLQKEKFDVLSQAHNEMRDGYAKCLNQAYREALVSFESARDKFDAHGDKWNLALANYFVGYALTNIDNSEESLKVLTDVQSYVQKHGYLWLDATVSHLIGNVNQRLQRHTSARTNYVHALNNAEKINDSYALQRNLIELARLSAFIGEKDRSLRYLSKMFRALSYQNNSRRQLYRNYTIAAEMLSRLRLYHIANELSVASIALADDLQDTKWISDARSGAAAIAIELGNFEKARSLIDEARILANDISDLAVRRMALARIATVTGEMELKLGNIDRSADSYREAVSFYERAQLPFFPEDANKGLLSSLTQLNRVAETESQIATMLRIIESYRSRIKDKDEKRSYLSLRAGIYEMACDFEVSRGNFEAAYNYVESARARSLLDSLQVDFNENERPFELADIRTLMPENVQLLQYALLPKRLLIWVVARDKFVQRTLEIDSAAFELEVDGFLKSILNRKSAAGTEQGHGLYQKLIAPIRTELDPTKELAIIPDKILFAVPFAAIPTLSGHPLIKDFAITYSPSASVYLRSSKIAATKNQLGDDETFLGVGNPKFDAEAFDGLPYLPSAVEEVYTAATGYKSKRIFTQERATASAFQKASQWANVIHFAGHYVVTPEDPMSSYMLFADDGGGPESCKLTNRELKKRGLGRTKLIVLAACQTGLETIYEGEGMVGLASIFLQARVPLVVASKWKVDSAATTKLMNRFHEIRSKHHLPTAQALRTAQIEMLEDKSLSVSEPFYWAGFAVFGGHAEY